MSKEIELKLTLPPEVAERFCEHSFLAAQTSKHRHLYNTYYDTPEFDLRRRGIALRLRRIGESEWVMTVKGGDSGAGGLAARSEWEAPTRPGVFDFEIVGDAALRAFLLDCAPRLQAVFTTDFTRRLWVLERPGARIELVLDRGSVVAGAGGREEAICEVELELLAGDSTDALFDLAIELSADFHLHPEVRSKAERGYALCDAVQRLVPFKAQASTLAAEMTPVEAFRAIALACVLHLQRNEVGVQQGGEAEFIHQARVAIRRLRSAFKLFAPVLAPAFVAVYAPRWKALAIRLGAARDWDVFVGETLPAFVAVSENGTAVQALHQAADVARRSAREAATAAFFDHEYSRLVLAFSAALLREDVLAIAKVPSLRYRGLGLKAFAERRLRRLEKAVEKRSRRAEASEKRRHKLRIDFKRLRYAFDFFAPLFGRKRTPAYQDMLARLQDVLGQLNDLATAEELCAQLPMEPAFSQQLERWLDGARKCQQAELMHALLRFARCRPPWRNA